MALNKDEIIATLAREDIEYRELENGTGWMLEILSPVEGSEMERLLRTIDALSGVQCIIIPNVGLSIQTANFEEEEAYGEVIGEEDGGVVETVIDNEGEAAVS